MGTFKAELDNRLNDQQVSPKFAQVMSALEERKDGSDIDFLEAMDNREIGPTDIAHVVQKLTGIRMPPGTIRRWRAYRMNHVE